MDIPYAKHEITDEDIKNVISALTSGALTNGPFLSQFEERFANYTGSSNALGVSSGTSGLHLAVESLTKPEDRGKTVLLPSLTFAATANSVLYAGLRLEFVDIDSDTLLIDVADLEAKLAANSSKYVGLMVVDFAGMPINIKQVAKICKKYGIWLIEDAAHALGAVYYDSGKSIKVGSGEYADATVFSFHPAKHITTGEGGMVTTNNQSLFQDMQLLRSHSLDRSTVQTKKDNWYYRIKKLGYNYRLSELHAALGLSQLSRIETNLARRRKIASTYIEALSGLDLNMQPSLPEANNAYHLFVVQTAKRKELYEQLKTHGIFAQIHYVPLHMQPFYKKLVGSVSLPKTERYYDLCISLPIFPTLKHEEQSRVIEVISGTLGS